MPNGVELRITFCAVGTCDDRSAASSGKMNAEMRKKKMNEAALKNAQSWVVRKLCRGWQFCQLNPHKGFRNVILLIVFLTEIIITVFFFLP